MQEYVQKSTSTTLPRSDPVVSGGLFSHCVAPASDGSVPSTGSGSPAFSTGCGAGAGRTALISFCSMPPVLASETRVSRPVSRPSAIAATPHSTSTPSARRTHSPAPSERFISANTLPPISSARPSEVAAPAA